MDYTRIIFTSTLSEVLINKNVNVAYNLESKFNLSLIAKVNDHTYTIVGAILA